MHADYKQRKSIESIRNFMLSNISNSIIKCDQCDSTGLKGVKKTSTHLIWTGEYCDKCRGIGYLPSEIIKPKENKFRLFINYIFGIKK